MVLRPRVCGDKRKRGTSARHTATYSGGTIPNWHLSQGGLHYAGGDGCSNDEQPRVRTYGNE